MRETSSRKMEHIRMVAEAGVEALESTLLEYVRIVHNPLPEIDLDGVDLSTGFCGSRKRLRAPLMITGMTGGHPDVEWINRELASIAEELGIAFGVGSQRAAIEDPSLARTFSVAREAAPNTVVVANLGAPQLSRGYGVKEARLAVEMIDADALAIHLNPGQEAYQDEGDPYYRDVIEEIAEINDELDVPVIVKETGTGLSGEAVRTLYRLGVRCFDVSGLGGTNWIKVEVLRSKKKHGASRKPAGPISDYWGNPTALAIMEARTYAPDSFIIASGGIRNGLEAGKSIALGANMAGVALPVLRALLSGGREGARRLLESMVYQLATILFMTGSRRVEDLWRAPMTVYGRLREEAEARGIDVLNYIYSLRLAPLLRRSWDE